MFPPLVSGNSITHTHTHTHKMTWFGSTFCRGRNNNNIPSFHTAHVRKRRKRQWTLSAIWQGGAESTIPRHHNTPNRCVHTVTVTVPVTSALSHNSAMWHCQPCRPRSRWPTPVGRACLWQDGDGAVCPSGSWLTVRLTVAQQAARPRQYRAPVT